MTGWFPGFLIHSDGFKAKTSVSAKASHALKYMTARNMDLYVT